MKTKNLIETRFHELLVKDCRGQATPAEKAKLDRYERLRNGEMNHSERRQCAAIDHQIHEMKRLLGKVEHMTKSV